MDIALGIDKLLTRTGIMSVTCCEYQGITRYHCLGKIHIVTYMIKNKQDFFGKHDDTMSNLVSILIIQLRATVSCGINV